VLTADNAVDALRRRGILPAPEGGAIDVRARGEIAETAAVHGRLLGMLERGGQQ
jgi:hypothetical protein